jgi:class 3 adenylate cyclase/pimeloyl-ACP methyl ester carboxylesterase
MTTRAAPPETTYAKNGDLHLAYQVFGGQRPDVLFLTYPTWPVDLMWDDPLVARGLRRLGNAGRVICCDLHGWGSSDTPSIPVAALQLWMDDIGVLLDASDVERATLVACGEVARPAMLFAASHPERVERLVLFNASARSSRAVDYAVDLAPERLQSQIEYFCDNIGRGPIVEWTSPSRAGDSYFRRLALRAERLSLRPGSLRTYVELFMKGDVRSVLASITSPTLVLCRSDNPHLGREHSQYLVDHIPNATLKELPGDDFLWNAGDVEGLFEEIATFVTGQEGAESRGERTLATVLFTDIVDSTTHASNVGDRRWRATLETYEDLVSVHVGSFRGRLVKSTGDGSLAVFDGPARAIQCAAEIRDSVQSLGVHIRAGLHTGEIEIMGSDIGGIAVHICARVASAANTDEVLVSEAVPPLVMGSQIAFQNRGEHELKGVPGSWKLFAVRG